MINNTILIEGQTIKLCDSGHAVVLFVNESRARIKLLSAKIQNFETAKGEQVSFVSSGREYDISPFSAVEIIKQPTTIKTEKESNELTQ